jgi:hypothetical protein
VSQAGNCEFLGLRNATSQRHPLTECIEYDVVRMHGTWCCDVSAARVYEVLICGEPCAVGCLECTKSNDNELCTVCRKVIHMHGFCRISVKSIDAIVTECVSSPLVVRLPLMISESTIG